MQFANLLSLAMPLYPCSYGTNQPQPKQYRWPWGNFWYSKQWKLHGRKVLRFLLIFYKPRKFSLLILYSYAILSFSIYTQKLFSILSKTKLQKFSLRYDKIQWTVKLFYHIANFCCLQYPIIIVLSLLPDYPRKFPWKFPTNLDGAFNYHNCK